MINNGKISTVQRYRKKCKGFILKSFLIELSDTKYLYKSIAIIRNSDIMYVISAICPTLNDNTIKKGNKAIAIILLLRNTTKIYV